MIMAYIFIDKVFFLIKFFFILFRANLGFQLNDKKAAINIYITHEKRKIPDTNMNEYGISAMGGICEKDKNVNIVVASAHYKDDFGLKPPKYDQLFPSIATHALVSLKCIQYSKN